ncbi:MAG: dihydrofolate reductase family protein [Chitinophagaceae bacterium]
MRNLKLQMHMSLDNYVNMEDAGKDFKWDDEVIQFCVENLEDVDTILLGRKTAEELIPFWDEVATNPGHKDFALGKRISETPKLVFSNSATHGQWKNTDVLKGNLNDEIPKLKKSEGKNILVYGGASFASSLVQNNLVDEFYFLLDPFCLGKGATIFKKDEGVQTFTFLKSKPFPCGTTMLSYKPNY